MKKSELRQLIRKQVKTVLNEGLEFEFKPTKKQKEIMALIDEMTENKRSGLIKYMFSVIGDKLNRPYGDWCDKTWKAADEFFEAYQKAMEKVEVKEADMKMKEVKMKKK